MKFWLSLLLGIVALVAIVYLLSAAVGLILWVAVAAVVIAGVVALFNYWWAARRERLPANARADERALKKAEKALREMEKQNRA